jgi:hypothetical protein
METQRDICGYELEYYGMGGVTNYADEEREGVGETREFCVGGIMVI